MAQPTAKTYGAVKALFGYLFEYKKEVFFLSALGVISALANGSAPYITGKFFDAVLEPERIFAGFQLEMPLWLFFLLLWTGIVILADIVDWLNYNKSLRLSSLLETNYIVKGFSSLFYLPISLHKNSKQGDMGDKISRAAGWMSSLLEFIVELAPQFLSVLVGFVFIYLINPYFSIIFIVGISVYLTILSKTVGKIVKLLELSRKTYSQAYGDAYGALSNIKEIKQNSTEKFETINLYKKLVEKAIQIWSKLATIWSGLSISQKFLVTTIRLVIFIFSVSLIHQGQISIGDLIAVNGYAAMIFGPFVSLGQQWQRVQNGLIYLSGGEKLRNQEKEVYSPKNEIKLKGVKGNISFKDVFFKYEKRDRTVLDGVNLEIKAGETVALVGRSGEGKSTLIDLISGYYFPNKGKIKIDGVSTDQIGLETLRRNIAVVHQEIVLFNNTIKHNIRYGNFKATDKEIEKAAREAHADEFVEKFPKKYNQVVGERGIKLSVGQKQRVAIARAVLRNPKILILDEPTSALDAHNEKMINESLERLMEGRTTIIIAHRLSTVRKADKIFVLENGKVIEEGNHNALIQIPNGIYKKMYELHIGLG